MIRNVTINRRRKSFVLKTAGGTLEYPFSRLSLKPSLNDPLVSAYVDPELAKQGFTYRLRSGKEDSVLMDQVREYNKDSEYLRELLLYRLTILARKALASSGIAKREVIRRMKTSPTQFYRLMDQTNTRKSIDEMIRLLTALDVPLDRYWKAAA
jgi:hypothetical protein